MIAPSPAGPPPEGKSGPELTPTGFVVGVDLGQSADSTAIVIIDRCEAVDPETKKRTTHQHVPYIHRFQLGTSYPDVVAKIGRLLPQLPLRRDKPKLEQIPFIPARIRQR